MIYVSQDQLDQVEYLIQQSIQGHHVLFDTDKVREVFASHAYFDEEEAVQEAEDVEHHIEKLILEPSLARKKAYLETLTEDIQKSVIRVYFNIIENHLYDHSQTTH